MSSTKNLRSSNFEVFGKVQGVFFRKYTKKKCDQNQVTGWIINTTHKTVQGTIQGDPNSVENVKRWLQTTGSPKSRIEKAEFFGEQNISNKTFETFKIIRDHAEVEKRTFER